MSVNNPAFNTRHVICFGGAVTASKNSTAVDAGGCGSVALVYSFGTTTTGTSGTVTLSLEESDASGSGFAAISGATTAALTTDSGGQNAKKVCISVSCIGRKRYIRAVLTVAGTVSTGATGPEFAGGCLIASNVPVSRASSAFDVFISPVV